MKRVIFLYWPLIMAGVGGIFALGMVAATAAELLSGRTLDVILFLSLTFLGACIVGLAVDV
jgi:hypothetical protein